MRRADFDLAGGRSSSSYKRETPICFWALAISVYRASTESPEMGPLIYDIYASLGDLSFKYQKITNKYANIFF